MNIMCLEKFLAQKKPSIKYLVLVLSYYMIIFTGPTMLLLDFIFK